MSTDRSGLTAQLSRSGHALLAAGAAAAALQLDLGALEALRDSWERLPRDAYLRDGGALSRPPPQLLPAARRAGVLDAGAAPAALAADLVQRPARRPDALVRADRAGGRRRARPGGSC